MAMQQQVTNLAAKLGGRISAANEQHKDKPIDTGFRRLPPGIRNGIAKLQLMTVDQYKDDKAGEGTKGKDFFRATAVVVHPEVFNGEKIAGMQTSLFIPLCDMPAKGRRKATSLEENWFDFQNLFKLLGIAPCPETSKTDPTGQKTWQYFVAAMKTLTDPRRPPTYISFSTRAWKSPLTPQEIQQGMKLEDKEEMVFETWHGLADLAVLNGQHSSASSGVSDNTDTSPQAFEEPPQGKIDPKSLPDGEADPDEVAYLVEIANSDPDGETEEGSAACRRLEELAWAAGWTQEQTGNASGWDEVGEMALAQTDVTVPANEIGNIGVGSKWKFTKRDSSGNKLTNSKGDLLPAHEVEVTSVNTDNKTCTLKTTKDGKDVVDVRTKKQIHAKWEWLE